MLAIIYTMPENQSDRTFMLELYQRFFRLMFFTARKYHLQQDDCEEVVPRKSCKTNTKSQPTKENA